MENQKLPSVFKPAEMEWEEIYVPRSGCSLYDKKMVSSRTDKIEINYSKYPAGYVTKWHTHPHGHGMYVLEGKLYTNFGIYGPGTFVWFPEGCLMEHGATSEADCIALFITNGPFELTEHEAPQQA